MLNTTMNAERAIRVLSALAHDTRLSAFRALAQAGRPVAAGELADVLGAPAPTLSFHLKALKEAEVVRCRRDGRSLLYAANFDTMQAVLRYLTEDCCCGLPKKR